MAPDSTRPRTEEVWATWTSDGKLWATARGGPAGAQLQAQWPDGRWASIGDFQQDGSFLNPNVPPSYMVKKDILRLRAYRNGQASGTQEVAVRPALTVSPAWMFEGGVWVSAHGGPEGARLQAQWPDGRWASIGDFQRDGSFLNPSVPPSYMWNEDTLRLRVHRDGLSFPPHQEIRVRPPLGEVWAAWTFEGRLWVNAEGGPEVAYLEAQWPDGRWASIGDFQQDGSFLNPNVPPSYMWNEDTLRLRVHKNGQASAAREVTVSALTVSAVWTFTGELRVGAHGGPEGARLQ
ncbi:hypothetical protein ACIBFB_20365, partial [Nocardiopsis sp. NPDC050513]|uniref:hypothetical protein n=1 Tax=Nocardiopsis sp. NPDC050513 TaxID=3364338 RepID=UPI00378C86F3